MGDGFMKSGKPIHPTNGVGSAPDAASSPQGTFIDFGQGPNRSNQSTMVVFVTNRDAANTLEISFANGKDGTWFAIAINTTLPIPAVCHNCRLRGTTGATADYSIMGIIG